MIIEVPNPFPILSGKLLGFGIEIAYAHSQEPARNKKLFSLAIDTPVWGVVFVWELS